MQTVEKYNRLLTTVIGDPKLTTPANRSVNAICVLSALICLILIPFNIFLGIWPIVILLAGLIIALGGLYYLARVKKQVLIATVIYAIGSYITVALTYLYNDGINGPAPLLFFLIFSLLIGFTIRKLHKYWISLHLLVGAGLMAVEYYYPTAVLATYHTKADRFIDFISGYSVTIIFMYLIIFYLRKAYSSERKLVMKHSEELAQSNAQKTKLFSIVAHDLKTPLNGLLGYLELLNTYNIPPEQKQTVEKQLLTSTKQTAEMLTNLLMWAKAQMDGIHPVLTELPLHNLLDPTVKSIKDAAEAKEINLRFHIPENIIVKADKEMLLLVIRNLLNNAIKFTNPKGTVVLSVEVHDDFARILIIDNGVGIPKEQRSNLFTVKTVSAYGTNKEKGFGLGLLLCKEFTEMQGGKIGYMSMEEKGSKFFIDLPIVYNLNSINPSVFQPASSFTA